MSAKIAPIFQTSSTMQLQSKEELIAANSKLLKENQALKQENAELKSTLRKRKSDHSAPDVPSNKKAKTPGQRKKLFEKWAKAAVRESAKTKMSNYDGMTNYKATVKETTPWSVTDFESLFCADNVKGGVKIQPTPDNKPTSQITILRFDSYDKIKDLFGEASISQDGYKAQAWKSRSFCKSFRCGDYPASLTGLEVHYNKSKCTLQLQFELQTGDCY